MSNYFNLIWFDELTSCDSASFCQKNHGVTFPLMKKSDVNGENTNEVFAFLKSAKKSLMMEKILWNFTSALSSSLVEVTLIKIRLDTVNSWSIKKEMLFRDTTRQYSLLLLSTSC